MKTKLHTLGVFALLLLVVVACNKDENPTNPTNPNNPADPMAALNLPATPYNYANQPFPFYLNTLQADNTPPNNPITDDGATLGRVLFFDRALSINNTLACGSCHQADKALSDPRVLSIGHGGGQTGRHSMSLVNARFYGSRRFFWDERAATLEAQVLMPIQDTVEMGLTLDQLVARIRGQAYYPTLFTRAFGDTAVSTNRIAMALAQYVRSAVSYQSKYDQGRVLVANTGDPFPNFTQQENMGKGIFNGPGTCAACHGTDAHIAPGARNNGLDATTTDAGVGGANGNPNQLGAFKSPSLRNIALNAPYMHDGRFATLQQVIEHYNSGVQLHPNLNPPLRTPGGTAIRLNLTPQQKEALLAFLNTLTDNTFATDSKFQDPFVR